MAEHRHTFSDIDGETGAVVNGIRVTMQEGGTGTAGRDGTDGREVEFQKSATHIQWRYVEDMAWADLVPLTEITGSDGEDGEDGSDGREVELSKSATHVRWRYVGEHAWTDLIALIEITGADGASAYEVAVANGFVGTEAEWLASLKGEPGSGGTGAVDSVNGQTGAVVLDAAAVGARPDTYVPAWGEVAGKPTTFPPDAHTHDDRYYTETEVDTKLGTKVDTSALTAHTSNTSNPHAVTKAQVGLGNVPNVDATSRANHTGTQAASTITGLAAVATSGAKADVGLGNVTNTSDANKPVSTAQQSALDAKADKTRSVNAQTGGTYTLVLTDAGRFVTMNNAGASTLTVPPNSSAAFPVGTEIEGAQVGAGQVTITAGVGVTVNATPGLKVAAQYGTFGLLKLATDTWLAYGRLSA